MFCLLTFFTFNVHANASLYTYSYATDRVLMLDSFKTSYDIWWGCNLHFHFHNIHQCFRIMRPVGTKAITLYTHYLLPTGPPWATSSEIQWKGQIYHTIDTISANMIWGQRVKIRGPHVVNIPLVPWDVRIPYTAWPNTGSHSRYEG